MTFHKVIRKWIEKARNYPEMVSEFLLISGKYYRNYNDYISLMILKEKEHNG